MEKVKRLVIREIDLSHKVIEPFALDDEFTVLTAYKRLLRACGIVYRLILRRILRLVNRNGRKVFKLFGCNINKLVKLKRFLSTLNRILHASDLCIKLGKKLGKRNFIVIVSEGVGSEYAPMLARKIEAKTGVESKFARFAHIVRGGNPNLRDRVMASEMGVFAVRELLSGNSNLVICQRNGDIEAIDINFALILDRMYKGKLKDGDLDRFSQEQISEMQAACARRRANIESLYATVNRLSL